MNDRVVGVAVLDTGSVPERLWVRCLYPDGTVHPESLAVYPEGSAKPETAAWSYRTEGNALHCRPSLHILAQGRTLFHSAEAWKVRFVGRDFGWVEPLLQLRAANDAADSEHRRE